MLLMAAPVTALVFGCGPGTAPVDDPPDGGPIDAAVASPFTLIVEPILPGLAPLDRPLTLIARDLDTGAEVVRVLPVAGAWPQQVKIEGFERGRWVMQVFIDDDGDAVFDDCPFPPRATDPEQLDGIDSFSGEAILRVVPGGTGQVFVEQRICGPGAPSTGLRGRVASLDDAPVAGPIMLFLAPQPGADDIGPALPPLRVVLQSDVLAAPLEFSIGQLAPGRYAVSAFADRDGDATPSPCASVDSSSVGGADVHLTPTRLITIEAGERPSLGDPLVLSPRVCPDPLTGLTGTVTLPPDLPADPEFDGPLGPVSGALRLAWFPSINAEAVANTAILDSIDARPLPHAFTVTGVPTGVWRMVAWIDRDRDGSFTPCGGLAGIDATWAQVEDVHVVDGEVRELAPIVLQRNPCDAAAETGLTGTLTVDVEPGAVGSGRPVRAELIALNGDPTRSLQLADNHTALPPEGRFIASGIPAGRYDVVVYVDTDRDGRLISCRQAEYGDRAIARRDAVTVTAGRITALGEVIVQTEACAVPRAELRPQFNFSDSIPPEIVADLRFNVRERGGWEFERRLRTGVSASVDTLFTESIDLAPGDFRLTAWLDTVNNGVFDDCDADEPDRVVARLDLSLDENTPVSNPNFVMDLACGVQ
ncbi:MAG: hypothetical protein ACI9U2_001078 [Bradymonadia bacterium]|jgi:hypothetical protein